MELNKSIGIYSTMLLMLLIQIPIELVGADYSAMANSTLVSIRVAGLLSNGVLVETSIDNVVPRNVSIAFRPEYLSLNTQGSTLVISYDARLPEDALLKSTSIEEAERKFDEEWMRIVQLLIVFATGLIILILEMFFLKIRGKDALETIDRNKTGSNNSTIDEESLLMLSSKNPEEYRKAVDMILKGELKVKKKRFWKMFSKIKKFVNLRR
ncbi:MAG: hypothetical protein QXR97_03585 [Thermoproteota archaeon]